MNVLDQDRRPILFDDTIRPFMFEFMSKRINVQLHRLEQLNPHAFMFVDEPGLQFLFSALSGYDPSKARKDMELFFAMIDRPRGIHLCGNPDWDFLLGLDIDILSLDTYLNGEIFVSYTHAIKKFLESGGVIGWGIVPTNLEPFQSESPKSLEARLLQLWKHLERKGIDIDLLLSQSLISPATCCLVNPDREKTVEAAFKTVNELSHRLRERFNL
jgi:hypothetical protein